MSKTKDAIMAAEHEHIVNNGVHADGNYWCLLCKEERDNLKYEELQAEADEREQDIASGWSPSVHD